VTRVSRAAPPGPEELRGSARDDAQLALVGEQAARLAVVGGGPDLDLVGDADEPGGDAQAGALGADRALHEVAGVELAADLGQGLGRPLVGHDRPAADDGHVPGGDLAEQRDGLLGEAVGG
jgi:hypothetical protein